MQEEDLDALEAKLTALCGAALGDPEDPVTEELAAKTVKARGLGGRCARGGISTGILAVG